MIPLTLDPCSRGCEAYVVAEYCTPSQSGEDDLDVQADFDANRSHVGQ